MCGGAGAGNGFHGASAVHTHMTNTRLTDPEVLENRFPVRVERFAIRKDSGGKGQYHGGNGLIRHLRFLEPMTVTVLSSNRIQQPRGLNGGQAGLSGKNGLINTQGVYLALKANDQIEVKAGDVFVMETPGGGGYGETLN